MVHIEELVQAFEATGHEVVVIGPAGMDGMKFGGQLGIVDHLKRLLPRHVYELLELVYNLPAYLRLRRAYLRHRPDFIYERYKSTSSSRASRSKTPSSKASTVGSGTTASTSIGSPA